MRKFMFVCSLLLSTLVSGHISFAQDQSKSEQQAKSPNPAPVSHFYRLDFTVEEVGADGKAINSRSYSTSVATEVRELVSIRTGSKVPIATGPYNTTGRENSPVPTQFQYLDLGVEIDVRDVHELGRQLSLILTADLTGQAETDPNLHQPIIRHNRWQGLCLIPTGKPMIVFSSDSLDSKGSTRILVTATPLQ